MRDSTCIISSDLALTAFLLLTLSSQAIHAHASPIFDQRKTILLALRRSRLSFAVKSTQRLNDVTIAMFIHLRMTFAAAFRSRFCSAECSRMRLKATLLLTQSKVSTFKRELKQTQFEVFA